MLIAYDYIMFSKRVALYLAGSREGAGLPGAQASPAPPARFWRGFGLAKRRPGEYTSQNRGFVY
jgi:hypothetical protein